jgi:BA14K-like protein
MIRVSFIAAAAAALSVTFFATAPASAIVTAGGRLPVLAQAATSDVQLAASNGQPRRVIRRGSNHQSFRRGNTNWNRNWHHNYAWNHHRRNRWGGSSFGFAVAPAIVGPGYGYGGGYGYESDYGYAGGYGNEGDAHIQYCLNRYRSYDPNSDTFMGYDGLRHPCNAY